jgi:hypothetical protein
MKKVIILILISIISICCINKKKDETNTLSIRDTIFVKELSDNSFIYKLTYSKDSIQDLRLKKLDIIQKLKGIVIQEIKLNINEISKNDLYFSINNDINFDGYNDICLLNYEGAYAYTYSYWIYNKGNNQFKNYKGLDEIQNPVILKDKKEICSSWHSGVSDFYLERYFWKKDSLKLKEKYEESETDKKRLTTTKLVNNKYVVKDSIIKGNIVMFMKCE